MQRAKDPVEGPVAHPERAKKLDCPFSLSSVAQVGFKPLTGVIVKTNVFKLFKKNNNGLHCEMLLIIQLQ